MEGGATAVAASSAIRPINKSVVHKISAGQVILDLSSAVKELVENSLDAGATSIEISLKEYGEEWFQVIDNGCGISPNDFKALALKHHTSKLVEFPDIQSLTTFGFRGEALSSLCALGDLTVETRTKNESVATHLTFDHCGVLVAEKKTARQIGTTMMVKKLFSNLPVRSKEFHRNIRKEYGKLISLLNAYALIAKGVRLICSNTTGRNSKSVVLKTQGSGCLKDNIINVFGMSTFTCLDPVSLLISDSCKVEGFLSKPGYGSGRNLGDRQFFFVNGRPVEMPKVTKLVNELYKGANSRQYPIAIIDFTVPTRVCDVNVTPDKRKIFLSDEVSILHSLRDALGKIYSPGHASYSINRIEELDHENGRSQLSLKQPSLNAGDSHEETCGSDEHVNGGTSTKNKDINRCPPDLKVSGNDDENSVGKDFALKGHGTKKADRLSCSRQLINDLATAKTDQHASVGFQTIEKGNTENIDSPGRPSIVQSSLAKFVTINKRKHESITTTLSEVPVLRNEPVLQSKKNNPQVKIGSSVPPLANFQKVDDCDETAKYCPQPSKCARVDEGFNEADITIPSSVNARAGECGENLGTPEKAPSVADSLLNVSSSKKLGVSEHLVDAKIPIESSALASETSSSGLKTGPSTLHFSFEELKIKRQQRLSRLQSCNLKHGRTMIKGCYNDATLDLSQVTEEGKAKALAAATKELERLFKKEDFGQMKVIGQFNLGFIIAKLDQDLFIVDQHAADEKYNYERLSQSTIFNQQPLLRPLQLELSPEEEIVVSMHMDTFRKNGFILQEDDHAPPGGRFYLKAVPFSKNITFGVADVKELVSILSDSQGECSMMGTYKMDTPNSVCPPRVRAMLASRACRSSVMIGDPLDKNEMRKIVNHLAGLKSPWNCPHGRPTMRHLVDLTTLRRRLDDEDDNIVSIL